VPVKVKFFQFLPNGTEHGFKMPCKFKRLKIQDFHRFEKPVTVVTANVAHFDRIRRLKVENWLLPNLP